MTQILSKQACIITSMAILASFPALAQSRTDTMGWFDRSNYRYDANFGLDYSYSNADDTYSDRMGGASDADTYDPGYSDMRDLDTQARRSGPRDTYSDLSGGSSDADSYDRGYSDLRDLDTQTRRAGPRDTYSDLSGGSSDADSYDRGYSDLRDLDTQTARTRWQGDQQAQGRTGTIQRGSGQSSNRRQTTISGTFERSRTLNLRTRQGQPARLTVCQVELQNGREVLVAFQPQNQRRMNLQAGDQVRATGTVGSISGRRVLLADQNSSGGRTFDVRQPSFQRSSSNRQ